MKQRIITALILTALVIPTAILGGEVFTLLIGAIMALAVYELLKIMHLSSWHISLDILAFIYAFYIVFVDQEMFFVSSFIIILFAIILYALSMVLECLNVSKINFLLGFLTFICIGLHCILNIRLKFGFSAILFIAIATFGSDTGAYFAGVTLGKHKLIPRLSPKKTIEGSIGGILLGTCLASVFVYFNPLDLSLIQSGVLAFILTITAQIGDLTFSSVKRYFEIKDFSNLLPGHGGVLDRIDSLLFNSLVFALFVTYFLL